MYHDIINFSCSDFNNKDFNNTLQNYFHHKLKLFIKFKTKSIISKQLKIPFSNNILVAV